MIDSKTISDFKKALSLMVGSSLIDEIVTPRDEVFARFQPVFSKEHLPKLS